MSEVWYRIRHQGRSHGYVDDYGDYRFNNWFHVEIEVQEIPVKRRTPKGVWVEGPSGRDTWVSYTARKRYCYPTIKAARASFIARRRKAIKLLVNKLQVEEVALKMATDMTNYVPGQTVSNGQLYKGSMI